MTSKHYGFELLLVQEVVCKHVGGASLDTNSLRGLRFSVYGHLCLYDSLRHGTGYLVDVSIESVKRQCGKVKDEIDTGDQLWCVGLGLERNCSAYGFF